MNPNSPTGRRLLALGLAAGSLASAAQAQVPAAPGPTPAPSSAATGRIAGEPVSKGTQGEVNYVIARPQPGVVVSYHESAISGGPAPSVMLMAGNATFKFDGVGVTETVRAIGQPVQREQKTELVPFFSRLETGLQNQYRSISATPLPEVVEAAKSIIEHEHIVVTPTPQPLQRLPSPRPAGPGGA